MMMTIIKEKLDRILHSGSQNSNAEEMCYLSGVADALQIIEEIERNYLMLGKAYYVISFKDYDDLCQIIIEQRQLLRITQTPTRTAYCFYASKKDKKPVVLYCDGKYGYIGSRVFATYEEANNGREYFYSNASALTR